MVNTMIFYMCSNQKHSIRIPHKYMYACMCVVYIIVHKLTEKIIVVPFEYVLMLSRNQQQTRSERIESTRVNI